MPTPNKRLFVSFSGGETSGKMTRDLLTRWRGRYDDIVVVFANTGEENEETLRFVRDCDSSFGFRTVWVEAQVHHGQRKGTTFRVVNYETASRCGEPFDQVIRKFGIPNETHPHCTRELKQRPMYAYIKSLGWEKGSYDVAVGIRADESRRRASNAAEMNIVYPLLDWAPTTKAQVNSFWNAQSFRLALKGYQGNCRWCWKKSLRKLLTIMEENPAAFDFPARMESAYGLVGPEFEKGVAPEYRRVFFRGNKSTQDLRLELAARAGIGWLRADDDTQDYDEDVSFWRCATESCEVDWSEDLANESDFEDASPTTEAARIAALVSELLS